MGKDNPGSETDKAPTLAQAFGNSLVYHGIQEPYDGVRELVNHVVSQDVLPSVHIADAPSESQFGSAAWHAQQLGAGVGMVVPFVLLKGAAGQGAKRIALAAESSPAMFRASSAVAARGVVVESAVIGAAYDGLLRPVHDNEHFWQKRGVNSLIGGVTFGVMGKTSQLMGNTTLQLNGIIEKTLAERSLIGARNGIVSGVAGGLINHEARALANGGDLLDAKGLAQSAYAFAFPGATMGAWHAATAEHAKSPVQKDIELHETLKRIARRSNPRLKELYEIERTGELTKEQQAERAALYRFPDQPHMQELTKREAAGGTLTENEKAVYYSTAQFPTNAAARELARREYLKELNDVEKEALRQARMEESFFEDMTPEYAALWKRADSNDPHVRKIGMYDGAAVKVEPNGPDKAIFTFGLGGCTATTVFIPQVGGGKYVAMTHYPTPGSSNVAHLHRLVQEGLSNRNTAEKAVVVVREPYEYVTDYLGTYRQQAPGTSLPTLRITSALREQLGDNVEYIYSPYSEMRRVNAKNDTTNIVRVPANPNKPALWEANLNETLKLGVEKKSLLERVTDSASRHLPFLKRSSKPETPSSILIQDIQRAIEGVVAERESMQ